MSATANIPVVTVATTEQKQTNAAVNAANDLPQLVATLQSVNPTMAGQIEGKAAVASGTIWGHLALLAVQALIAKFAINWNDQFQVEAAGFVALGLQAAFGIAATWIEKSPITGLFSKKVLPAGPLAKATVSVNNINQKVT